ncbi:ATP-binding protein [Streptomyces sp. NPDC018057]|uniref:ATP-binding protein n=1 Tax=unclassified Streptomyces TaxID=2593676 RepID=UPI00378F2BC1
MDTDTRRQNGSGQAPAGPVVMRWSRTARSVGSARRALRRELEGWGLENLGDAAELVLSELVTNAVRHARSPQGRLVETRYERVGHAVRIEVHDACGTRPVPCAASVEDEQGRGLSLVDVLTGGRWGVRARGGVGKAVWALIGTAPDVPAVP